MNDAAQLSRLALRVVATVLGSFGIFCLHCSFVVPRVALHAIVCLGTAAAITLALGDGK